MRGREDAEKVRGCSWHVSSRGYVVSSIPNGKIKLHRLLMGVTDPKIIIDHKDGDTLNNQKENLRICTSAENSRNSKPNKTYSTTGYKGVSYNKRVKRWTGAIIYNRKKIFLGYFSSPEVAANAYNEAAKKYHGEFARLNNVHTDILTGTNITVKKQ
jgi:hypothetical protein